MFDTKLITFYSSVSIFFSSIIIFVYSEAQNVPGVGTQRFNVKKPVKLSVFINVKKGLIWGWFSRCKFVLAQGYLCVDSHE